MEGTNNLFAPYGDAHPKFTKEVVDKIAIEVPLYHQLHRCISCGIYAIHPTGGFSNPRYCRSCHKLKYK
jgi:hypothetical protein